MANTLRDVQEWYESQCNGSWEHQNGIRIDTLDNPGWSVTIDLEGTEWPSKGFEELRMENGKTDWVNCWKDGTKFRGCGDPTKLEAILQYFLNKCVHKGVAS